MLPPNLTEIGESAFFADRYVVLGMDTPLDEQSIYEGTTVCCYRDSLAWTHAKNAGCKIVLLDSTSLNALPTTLALPGQLTMYAGETATLPYTLYPQPASVKAVWSSMDPKIAAVDAGGRVTALRTGDATITLKIGKLQTYCSISVHTRLTDFQLPYDEICLPTGGRMEIELVGCVPSDADEELNLMVDGSFASSGGMTLIANSPGCGTLTVRSFSGVERSCPVCVYDPVTAVSFAEPRVNVYMKQARTLEATVTSGEQTYVNRLVRFESSAPAVATVSSTGVVTPVKPGKATITATAIDNSGIRATCEITVVDGPPALILPASLGTIEAEAFINDAALGAVVIQDGATAIEARAFKGCAKLASIEIPASVTSIAPDAFEGCAMLTIKCPKGSAAEAYAKAHGIPCAAA